MCSYPINYFLQYNNILLLVLLLAILCTQHNNAAQLSSMFNKVRLGKLNGKKLEIFASIPYLKCLKKCLRHDHCTTINYHQHMQQCELIEDQFTHHLVIKERGWQCTRSTKPRTIKTTSAPSTSTITPTTIMTPSSPSKITPTTVPTILLTTTITPTTIPTLSSTSIITPTTIATTLSTTTIPTTAASISTTTASTNIPTTMPTISTVAAAPENIALNKTITMSTYFQDKYPFQCNDGNISTFCSSEKVSTDSEPWVHIVLGETEYTISHVTIRARGTNQLNRVNNFGIYIGNDGNKATNNPLFATTQQNTANETYLNNSVVKGKHFFIYRNNTSAPWSVSEIEVYGYTQ